MPTESAPPATGTDAQRTRILVDQVENLYSFIPTSSSAHLFLATLVSVALWDNVDQGLLLAWFTLRVGYATVQPMLNRAFKRTRPQGLDALRWGHYMTLLAIPSGILWGLPALLFLDPSEPLTIIVVMTVLMGVCLGACSADAAFPPVFYAFTLPVQTLLITGLWYYQVPSAAALSAVVMVGLVVGISYTRVFHRILEHSARLRYQNVQLRSDAEEKSGMLESTLESMDQGITLIDEQGRLRMWNRRFAQLLGIPDNHAHETLRPGDEFSRVLATAVPPLPALDDGNTEFRRDHGVVEIRQTRAPNGRRVLTVSDISELKRREDALQQAKNEAEQANAAKTRFLAAASHDLRQPIHALGLFLSTLDQQARNPETGQVLDQIDSTIAVIGAMLDSLLDISKLDAGLLQPNPAPVELNLIFERLDAEFGALAQERGSQLRVRPTSAWVFTDADMLERMLRNLVANAVRYAPRGRILIAARARPGSVCCMVCDNGPGIAPEHQQAIFQEFHQLSNPQRDRRQGLGLGLAIVQRLGRLLDHPVQLRSRPGHGACFCITPPTSAVPHSPAAESPTVAVVHNPLQDAQLLVVEDDIIVQQGMLALLRGWGCEVALAESLEQARTRVTTCTPDALLVDYRLPGGTTARDVIADLRARIGRPLPAIIITGDTDPRRLTEATAEGCPLLHKPVQPAKLRATLNHLLNAQN